MSHYFLTDKFCVDLSQIKHAEVSGKVIRIHNQDGTILVVSGQEYFPRMMKEFANYLESERKVVHMDESINKKTEEPKVENEGFVDDEYEVEENH